ncbi:MAG: hypothetical protein MPEBLZ_02047 [Candidatus Methanoperedens nitroreducens]|uniref:Uncharacterized protein n=1 Tax=Candidatus Methanoperedens nitratireducens TaxID=1392998 RepID=A0A0P8AGA3_9EURY|nr:MAG: hypothetical protein MPEBLZ_02047 [Candidatus Methanoperedens sp. BLZ1]
MSCKVRESPVAVQTNQGLTNDRIDFEDYICFGNYTAEIKYASVFELNCDVCNIKLVCARKTAGED